MAAPFARSANHTDAQNHDRLAHDDVLPSEPVEITAWQKMLSATSGSLLTGLLGMLHPCARRRGLTDSSRQ